jgi:CheY-like chemotaxis protein
MTPEREQVRVLVVDDEPNIVDVISMALRFEGFEVESAATGADAIAAVAARTPQLLVLDVMLPDIDGFEVARRLAAARAEVPIIFLTARDSTEDKSSTASRRRRRLRDQAVQPRGAGRADPHDPAPLGTLGGGQLEARASETSSSTRTPTR